MAIITIQIFKKIHDQKSKSITCKHAGYKQDEKFLQNRTKCPTRHRKCAVDNEYVEQIRPAT